MAHLEVKRKSRSNWLVWLIIIIIVIALAAFGYQRYYGGGNTVAKTDSGKTTSDSVATHGAK
jgi:hypothetical protein